MVSIVGLDKAVVLAALYNAAKPQRMGFLHYKTEPLTKDKAKEVIGKQGLSFDYLGGRVMKIDLSGDSINPWSYDRDNGQGAVARAIAEARSGKTNSVQIQETHFVNTTAQLEKESGNAN